MDNVNYRIAIYTEFARQANKAGIDWFVLHGIEGYPSNIGRDLDITCRSVNDETALFDIFLNVLTAHPETQWKIFPSPIWGRRLLGVTSEFDVAELHIIRPLRMFLISYIPNWNEKTWIEEVFPVSEYLTFSKAAVMPAFAGENWESKIDFFPDKNILPHWLVPIRNKMERNSYLSRSSKIELLAYFSVLYPKVAIVNFWFWIKRKINADKYPTVPLVLIGNAEQAVKFKSLVEFNLSKVFLAVKNGDLLSNREIKKCQGRQQLVYITKARENIQEDIVLDESIELDNDFLVVLIDEFKKYNQRWVK